MNNCACNTEDQAFWGGDYKFAVSMTAEGFDMNTDDWIITVTAGCKSVSFTPSTAAHDAETGEWFICIDTDLLGFGQAYITFEAHVPDTDFPNGYRREKETYKLMFIKTKD